MILCIIEDARPGHVATKQVLTKWETLLASLYRGSRREALLPAPSPWTNPESKSRPCSTSVADQHFDRPDAGDVTNPPPPSQPVQRPTPGLPASPASHRTMTGLSLRSGILFVACASRTLAVGDTFTKIFTTPLGIFTEALTVTNSGHGYPRTRHPAASGNDQRGHTYEVRRLTRRRVSLLPAPLTRKRRGPARRSTLRRHQLRPLLGYAALRPGAGLPRTARCRGARPWLRRPPQAQRLTAHTTAGRIPAAGRRHTHTKGLEI